MFGVTFSFKITVVKIEVNSYKIITFPENKVNTSLVNNLCLPRTSGKSQNGFVRRLPSLNMGFKV